MPMFQIAMGMACWIATLASLTSAGYLEPDDVEAASRVVPAMGGWIGRNNREVYCAPLLHFRESRRRCSCWRMPPRLPMLPSPRSSWPILADLGWRHRDGRPLEGDEIYRLDAFAALVNLLDRPAMMSDRNWVSPAAASLSRAALLPDLIEQIPGRVIGEHER